MKKQDGFTLVELIVTMAVFLFVIASSTAIFIPLLSQTKQQGKIVASDVEGMIGLDILRADVEQAGIGLPWTCPDATKNFPLPYWDCTGRLNYAEATDALAIAFNDSPVFLPRPLLSGRGTETYASDHLVVKSTMLGTGTAPQRWSRVTTGTPPMTWSKDALQNGDRVIIIKPKVNEKLFRELRVSGASFSTPYAAAGLPADFSPFIADETFLIYGLADPGVVPRMPFNRADYFISMDPALRPGRCHPSTGVLVKTIVSQRDGSFEPAIPLIDCVADFKVIYQLDTSVPPDGTVDLSVDDITIDPVTGQPSTGASMRNQIKAVKIFILAHKGQRDPNFTYIPDTANAGSTKLRIGEFGLGHDFDFAASLGNNWTNYRWAVHTLTVKPENL